MTEVAVEREFRINNKRLLLTYGKRGESVHLNKAEYELWLRAKSAMPITMLRLAHETGEEGDYPHTHVVVEWERAFQTRDVRFFDYNEYHPNIKKLPSAKALKDALIYISKEDPENADLKRSSTGLVGLVTRHKTLADAIGSEAEKFSDVTGIMQIYNLKNNVPKRFDFEPHLEWQLELVAMCEENPDPRKIIWYFDQVGNNGKTAMCKWLYVNYPNDWLVCKDMGTSRDAATIVSNALASGWTGWGFILDLPRSAENHTRIYSYLEEIKDGFVTSQKYNGRTCIFDNPHVIVMANWLPQIGALSRDRWDIRNMMGLPLTLDIVEASLEDRRVERRLTERQTERNMFLNVMNDRMNDRPTYDGLLE